MEDNKKNIKGITCFFAHQQFDLPCEKKDCRCWFDSKENNNCVILCVKKNGTQRQQDIGQYFSLTRMRVCQIEKQILSKVNIISEKLKEEKIIDD